MRSKIIIVIFAVAIYVVGYIAIQNMGHDDHQHDYEQQVYAHNETEPLDVHDNEGQAVELTSEEIREIALETAIAGPGTVEDHIGLTGEIKVDRLGKSRLAYEIDKRQYGYYISLEFHASGEVVQPLEEEYRLSDEVLRFMTYRITPAQLKQREMDSKKVVSEVAEEGEK